MEEYPIHPTLDQLIQSYKKFSQIEFPRGIPQPAANWKELLQGMTQYEALIIQRAQEYLSGAAIQISDLAPSNKVAQALAALKIRTPEDDVYLKKIHAYKNQIEDIAHLIEDCAAELGNPCKVFRA